MKLKEKNFLELETQERRKILFWKEINKEHKISEFLEGEDPFENLIINYDDDEVPIYTIIYSIDFLTKLNNYHDLKQMSRKLNKPEIKDLIKLSKHNNLLQKILMYILNFIYFFRYDERGYNKRVHKMYNELDNINLVLTKS